MSGSCTKPCVQLDQFCKWPRSFGSCTPGRGVRVRNRTGCHPQFDLRGRQKVGSTDFNPLLTSPDLRGRNGNGCICILFSIKEAFASVLPNQKRNGNGCVCILFSIKEAFASVLPNQKRNGNGCICILFSPKIGGDTEGVEDLPLRTAPTFCRILNSVWGWGGGRNGATALCPFNGRSVPCSRQCFLNRQP